MSHSNRHPSANHLILCDLFNMIPSRAKKMRLSAARRGAYGCWGCQAVRFGGIPCFPAFAQVRLFTSHHSGGIVASGWQGTARDVLPTPPTPMRHHQMPAEDKRRGIGVLDVRALGPYLLPCAEKRCLPPVTPCP